jgi:serine/threonine protein kinase/GTPase SAR1 family protein
LQSAVKKNGVAHSSGDGVQLTIPSTPHTARSRQGSGKSPISVIQSASPATICPLPASISAPIKKAVSRALTKGKKRWGRSKIMIVGDGRVGKSALANSIMGRKFEDTVSTQGLNQITCDIQAATDFRKGWRPSTRPQKELEAALARMVMEEKDPVEEDSLSRAKYYSGTPPLREFEDAYQNEFGRSRKLSFDEANGDVSSNYAPRSRSRSNSFVDALKKSAGTSAGIVLQEGDVNNDLVISCLSEGIICESKCIVSLFDFGGQSVFNVIHPFFLTRLGVYIIVFNMEDCISEDEDVKEECLSQLSFWINSVVVHTSNSVGNTAPIVLAGTHKDTVKDIAEHQIISNTIESAFCKNSAWKSVIEYEFDEYATSHPCSMQSLVFFPIDNTMSSDDPTMVKLMTAVDRRIDESDYVHEERPLNWLQVYDLLMATKQDYISLETVFRIGRDCGLLVDDVPAFLNFFHAMGLLMWHEEETLRNVVILNPIDCFVVPAARIICQHYDDRAVTASKVVHETQIQKKCKKNHRLDFDCLVQKGILSEKLMWGLLSDFGPQKMEIISRLLIKYGLIVELRSEGVVNEVLAMEGGKSFIVPALLPLDANILPTIPAHFSCPAHWETARPDCVTFYFVFTTLGMLSKQSTLSSEDLETLGFLPSGLFERLICKAVNWSQHTSADLFLTITVIALKRNVAILCYGNQEFRLIYRKKSNCIQVDVVGENPISIHKRLDAQLQLIVKECLKSLLFFTCVPYEWTPSAQVHQPDKRIQSGQAPRLVLLPLIQFLDINAPINGNISSLNRCPCMISAFSEHRLLSSDTVQILIKPWVQVGRILESYDVYFSYRWNAFDAEFTSGLQDFLTNYSVGETHRSVVTFMDHNQVKNTQDLQTPFCRALVNSTVMVAIVSDRAIESLVHHNPSRCDNLLVEWLCGLICLRIRQQSIDKNGPFTVCEFPFKISRIMTFICGDECLSMTVEQTIRPELLKQLPEVKPTESINRAIVLLYRLNINLDAEYMQLYIMNLTVEKIVRRILRHVYVRPTTAERATLSCMTEKQGAGAISSSAGTIMKELRMIYESPEEFDGEVSIDSSRMAPPAVTSVVTTGCSTVTETSSLIPPSIDLVAQTSSKALFHCNSVPIMIAEIFDRRIMKGQFTDTKGHVERCVIKKCINSRNRDELEDFHFEVRNLKYLKEKKLHKENCCVELYCVYMNSNLDYFVMEDFGENLNSVLVSDCPSYTCEIVALKLMDALDRLHSLGVMHGDLKPENILVRHNSVDFEVKLCDLESSRFVGKEQFPHFSGRYKYSPGYDFPEVCTASPYYKVPGDLKASFAIDSFSLGLVLWQLFNNQSQSLLQLQLDMGANDSCLLTDQQVFDSRLRCLKHCTTSTDYILRLCRFDPEDRLTNIRQLEADLERRTVLRNAIQQRDEAIAAAKSEIDFLRRDVSNGIERIETKLDGMLGLVEGRICQFSDELMQCVRSDFGTFLQGNTSLLTSIEESLIDSVRHMNQTMKALSSNSSSAVTLDQFTAAMLNLRTDLLSVCRDRTTKSDLDGQGWTAVGDRLQEMITAIAQTQSLNQQELKEIISTVVVRYEELIATLTTAQRDIQEIKQELAQSGSLLSAAAAASEVMQRQLGSLARDSCDKATQQQVNSLHAGIQALTQSMMTLLPLPINDALQEIKGGLEKQIAAQTAMLNTLLRNTHSVPTLVLVLPAVQKSKSLIQHFDPRNLVANNYVLYFVCSHTLQIVPCGPQGQGYQFRRMREWVKAAAPVLLVGLSLLQLGLTSSGIPIPIPGISQLFDTVNTYQNYIDAAISSLQDTFQSTADSPDAPETVHKDHGDLSKQPATINTSAEGTRAAHQAVQDLMAELDPTLQFSGMRFVTDAESGISAWIADNDEVESSFHQMQGARRSGCTTVVTAIPTNNPSGTNDPVTQSSLQSTHWATFKKWFG